MITIKYFDKHLLEDMLTSFTIKTDDGCIVWSSNKTKEGYGIVRYDNNILYAHRLVWFLNYGEIPEKICICHKCDNRACCNIDHLFMGTQRDNILDAIKKGRFKQHLRLVDKVKNKYNQSLLHKGVLSVNNILYIKKSKLKIKTLCEMYGVGRTSIVKIRGNRGVYGKINDEHFSLNNLRQ